MEEKKDARLDYHPRSAAGKVQSNGQQTIPRRRSAFAPFAVGKAPYPLECSNASAVQRMPANNTPSCLGTRRQPAVAAAHSPLRHVVVYARNLCIPRQELALDQRLDTLLDVCW